MVALQQVVLNLLNGFISLFKNGLAALSTWLRLSERRQNEEAGGNKVDLENRKQYDKDRKDAKDIGSNKHTNIKSSGRMRGN